MEEFARGLLYQKSRAERERAQGNASDSRGNIVTPCPFSYPRYPRTSSQLGRLSEAPPLTRAPHEDRSRTKQCVERERQSWDSKDIMCIVRRPTYGSFPCSLTPSSSLKIAGATTLKIMRIISRGNILWLTAAPNDCTVGYLVRVRYCGASYQPHD